MNKGRCRVIKFNKINYLKEGNSKQRRAYDAINNLGIMESLDEYHPILCGTLPLGIDVEGSDLDIIMQVDNIQQFKSKITHLYEYKEAFRSKQLLIRDVPTIKVNFY